MNKVISSMPKDYASSVSQVAPPPTDVELLASYETMPTFDLMTKEHRNCLLKFLRFAHKSDVTTPTKQDFLDFASKKATEKCLVELKKVFEVLFKGHPVIAVELQEAISEKRRAYKSKRRVTRKHAAKMRVKKSAEISDWPEKWQIVWCQLQEGRCPSGKKPFAESTLLNMKENLNRYVCILKKAGLPIEINVANLRAYEQAIKDLAPAEKDAKYKNEGKRAQTFRTTTRRLIQFGTELGISPSILDDFRTHEKCLEKEAESEGSLKYGRLEKVPDYRAIYKLACHLLSKSFTERFLKTRSKLRNQAAIIALWMFMPLRLSDGLLRWGVDIGFQNNRYCLDVATNKTGKRIMARLHPKLNRFFDALVFQDVNHNLGPEWLEYQRQKLIEQNAPVFHDHLGNMYAKKRPSKVWREHFGTGAHIARTMAHTALGKKGEKGVQMALALCAQSDFKTRLHYQADAISFALGEASQKMMDQLVEEVLTIED